MLRGNMGNTLNKIRVVAHLAAGFLILNHIQKSALDVDLSGFLKL
jgi:hypothetical protein